jgi:hypothetical protein
MILLYTQIAGSCTGRVDQYPFARCSSELRFETGRSGSVLLSASRAKYAANLNCTWLVTPLLTGVPTVIRLLNRFTSCDLAEQN